MRLRTIGHPLTDTLIAALEACNIKSDTDLIFSGTPTDIWLRLPPNTVSLKELESIVKQVLQKLSAAGSTGSELLVQENSKRERLSVVELSSGVQALDDLVGGFGYQEILEVSGEKGSGKTVVTFTARSIPMLTNDWIGTCPSDCAIPACTISKFKCGLDRHDRRRFSGQNDVYVGAL